MNFGSGFNIRFEGKVFFDPIAPEEPTPWDANSLAFFPMDTDMLDATGKSTPVVSAIVQTTQVKNGAGAGDFTFAPRRVQVPHADCPPIAGDWTFETWVYGTATASTPHIMSGYYGTAGYQGFLIFFTATNQARIVATTLNDRWTMDHYFTLTQNAWNHVAYEKHGITYRLYVNGVMIKDWPSLGTMVDGSAAAAFGLRNAGTSSLVGYLDDIHISNVARYQGVNFTP